MFGHQDDGSIITDGTTTDQSVGSAAAAPAATTDLPTSLPAEPADTSADPSQTVDQSHDDELKDILSPAGGYPIPASEKVHTGGEVASAPDDLLDTSSPNGDLAAIKIQALDELYPLIDKLNLDPSERYKTLMMMIQASDNQELVKAAYDAAHSIPDEKIKAQALLDIVNEINYFTQNPGE